MKIRESGENYLEAILIIQNEKGHVRSVDIAKKLSVSKPSVSRAICVLKKAGHVKQTDNLTVELTKSGEEIAKSVYARHLFLTNLFIKIGVCKKTAEIDACRMEHTLSNETFNKLKKYYNDKLKGN